jgi:hypothetical protein
MDKRLIFITLLCLVFSCKKTVTPGYHSIPFFDVPKSGYYIGETVNLTVSQPANNEIYTWDFGDGNTAQGASVTHQYVITGKYRITLSDQLNGFDRGGVIKFINIFPGNASFRLTTNSTAAPLFVYAFTTSTVPHGPARQFASYETFIFQNQSSPTDTTFVNIPDGNLPLYLNIVGYGNKPVQYSYTMLFDKTKLYQNQDIELADTTMVYCPQYFTGPKIPMSAY